VPEPPSSPQGFDKFVETLTTMFPIWVRAVALLCARPKPPHHMPSCIRLRPDADCCCQVILGATIGITKPSAVTWLDSNLFTYALGFLMLSMGLTLTVEDFKKVRLGLCFA